MSRLLALALALLLAAGPARALQSNAGADTAQFLSLGAGARALGMGEAYGPIAEGPEAIYWNPAGLAQSKEPEVSYSRSEFLKFFHHDFAAFAVPVRLLHGVVGASYTRLSQESLPLVTSANQQLGSFTPHSDAFSFAFARSFDLDESEHSAQRDYFGRGWAVPNAIRPLREELEDGPWVGSLMVGGAVKAVSETIYQRSASAVAFDGGALFRPTGLDSLTLSFALRNAGGKETFISEAENLPVETDLGLSWDARGWGSRWLLAFEAAVPYYGNPYAKSGVEYTKTMGDGTAAAIRAGYRTQLVYNLSPLAGLTFGLGLKWSKLSADFGFEPGAELGETYRFSLGAHW